MIVKPQGMPVFRTGGDGSGLYKLTAGAGEESVCASVQSALPYSLAPIASLAATADDGDGGGDDKDGGIIQMNVLRRPQVTPSQPILSTHPINPPPYTPSQPILATHLITPLPIHPHNPPPIHLTTLCVHACMYTACA